MGLHSEALFSNLLRDLALTFPDTDFTVCEEWPGMSPRERQASALVFSLLKKYQDVKSEDADSLALESFLQSNIRCKEWELRLNTSGDEVMFGEFKSELYKFFNPEGFPLVTDISEIVSNGRVGPGASVGALGNDFYTKLFASPGGCTSKGLRTLYEHYTCLDPNWARAESTRYTNFGPISIVEGNRLSYVDKNATISRVICTEPNINMFFQLGLGAIMEKRLIRYFGLDIRNQQDKNRELARYASLTGKLSTIDLSAASDSVSLRMLEEVMPIEVIRWLKLFRSPTVTLPDGRVEQLHMVSSMGNGFTFPLETIIFACVVSAVYRVEGIPRRGTTCRLDVSPREIAHKIGLRRRYGLPFPHDPSQVVWRHGNFGVFGDDIICESRVVRKIIRLLELLGFKVNAEKSFVEGPFRESCGADYFHGLPVRGVYIKSLRTQASRYVAINRLNEWSALTGIPLPRTVSYLLSGTRKIYVPLGENDDAGIKVPSTMLENLGCKIDGRKAVLDGPIYGSIQYKAWTPELKQLRIDWKGSRIRGPGRTRLYNEDGLYLAFLRGDIINGTWSIRNGEPKYRTTWSTTLYWDGVPTVGKQFPIGTKALAKAILANVC